jgi:hypothetical protein
VLAALGIARSSNCSKKCPLCRAQIILPYVPSLMGKRSLEQTGEKDAHVLPNMLPQQREFESLWQSFLQRRSLRAGNGPTGSRARVLRSPSPPWAATQNMRSPTRAIIAGVFPSRTATTGADLITSTVATDRDDDDDDDDAYHLSTSPRGGQPQQWQTYRRYTCQA